MKHCPKLLGTLYTGLDTAQNTPSALLAQTRASRRAGDEHGTCCSRGRLGGCQKRRIIVVVVTWVHRVGLVIVIGDFKRAESLATKSSDFEQELFGFIKKAGHLIAWD